VYVAKIKALKALKKYANDGKKEKKTR